jgi:hypothetical protein
METKFPRGTRLLAMVMLVTFLSACASAPHQSVRHWDPAARARLKAQTVAVAAGQFTPEARLESLVEATAGKAAVAGAGAGAASGAGAWVKGLSEGHCSGWICGGVLTLYMVALPVFVAAGAIIGAAVDASQAQSDEALNKVERDMRAGLAQLKLQEAAQAALAFELSRSGFAGVTALGAGQGPSAPADVPRYPGVQADLVVEVAVLGVEIVRARDQRGVVYAPVLHTRGRLVRREDGGVEDEIKFDWTGPFASSKEWIRDEARFFIAALNVGMHDVAEALAYELLLAWHPPRGGAPSERAKDLVPPYALKPERPPVARVFDLRGAFSEGYRGGLGGLKYVYVESIQPRLAWERFPRDFDGIASERVSNVTYDLRVYRAANAGVVFTTGLLVYERSGLTEPEHRISESLVPCQRYTWTVRARFTLDGQPRATEWGSAANAWGGMAMEPWEIRRGAPHETLGRNRVDLRQLYYPFRAPTWGASQACKG